MPHGRSIVGSPGPQAQHKVQVARDVTNKPTIGPKLGAPRIVLTFPKHTATENIEGVEKHLVRVATLAIKIAAPVTIQHRPIDAQAAIANGRDE
jgi:hypothetical protein